MRKSILTLEQMDTGVRFGHADDERGFFEWLQRIPCVETIKGEYKRGLVVRLKRRPGNSDLRSLLALCRRYDVDMRQLAKFETSANRHWFCDPINYWHQAVFGDDQQLK